jgi:hypothetical protein
MLACRLCLIHIILLYCLNNIQSINQSYVQKVSWKKFEDTKAVIRNRKSKKGRQLNGQRKKKQKDKNNNLQTTTQKTEDRATWAPLKTRGELRCSGKENSSCTASGSRRVTLVTNLVLRHEWNRQVNEIRSAFIFFFINLSISW